MVTAFIGRAFRKGVGVVIPAHFHMIIENTELERFSFIFNPDGSRFCGTWFDKTLDKWDVLSKIQINIFELTLAFEPLTDWLRARTSEHQEYVVNMWHPLGTSPAIMIELGSEDAALFKLFWYS